MPSTQTGHNRRRLRNALLVGGLAGLLVAGAWWLLETGRQPSPPPTTGAPAEEEALQREITLYFAGTDGRRLIARTGFINECRVEEDCLRMVVEALIAGPADQGARVLPAASSLLGLERRDSLVILDFDKDFLAGHPGGTQSELLTVYALANTLAVNFPHIRQVGFKVAGRPLETIKGHVDLRQPITPDFSLVEEDGIGVSNVPDMPTRSD